MKFLMIVEGETEKRGVPDLLARSLANRGLPQRIGIDAINLKGGGTDLFHKVAEKGKSYVRGGPRFGERTTGVFGLLDLYNPSFDKIWPKWAVSRDDRIAWAVEQVENQVSSPMFRMFFAVHEVEPWILSQPDILPFKEKLSGQELKRIAQPETVNFTNPPAGWLKERRRRNLGKEYKKTTDGPRLMQKLDPTVIQDKCPQFGKIVDFMVERTRGRDGHPVL